MNRAFRFSHFWCWLLACCLWWILPAQAANYVFPGTLPGTCSGSGTSYTCGSVTLASGDTVSVSNASTTISFTAFNTNNAQVNAANTSNLTFTISGALTVASGATIKANITAGSVSSSGAVTYVGSLTTTGSGAITLGAGTTVSGGLTTGTGAVTLLTGTAMNYTTVGSINAGGTVTINSYNSVNGPVVGYLLSAAGHNTINGSITSSTTYVSLGGNATVTGSIYSQTYVDTGGNSNISGSITAATSYIDTGTATTVGGSMSALGTYVDIHGSASVGGSIYAKSYVSMTTNSGVVGNVTAESTVYLGSGSTVSQCVRAKNANTITVPSAGAVGGACCGSGSTCANTCVTGTPKPAACSWPQSGLVAEYRFEESSYNGTAGEVRDSSGNKRHGKIVGGTTSTASGKICRGILVPKNLTSAIDAFDTGIDAHTVGNSGTAAFWYKSVTSGVEHRMLYDATTSAAGKFYLYRDDQGSGVDLNAHITDGGGTVRNVDKVNAMSDAAWTHMTVTWRFTTGSSATRMTLYVNGVQQDTQTYTVATGKIADAISTIYFGDNRSASSVELNSANGYMDQIKLYDADLTASEVASVYAESPACTPSPPHHLEVTTSSATGPMCVPVTYTIRACADAACSSLYTTGLTGNLVLSGSPTVTYTPAFTIASGNSSTTVSAHVTSAGNVTAGLSGLSTTPTAGSSPYCGMGTAATVGGSCVFAATTAGLLFNVPDHVAETSQAFTVSAVRSSDNATVCTPAFASVSKNVTFKCSYSNPSSGTRPVRVGGAALNASNSSAAACDGGGRVVSLSFNGSGVASTTAQYADVGQMGLTATYTGAGSDAGLTMSGSDTFIAAPANLLISGVTAGNIAAGSTFAATVTGRNNAGATTANLGNETAAASAVLTFAKQQPTGAGASSGAFAGALGAFSNGVATASNLTWSEVGKGDLNASLSNNNYLGSGLNATGSSGSGGAVGPFVAHHFTTESVAPGCGTFTYGGQPFGVTIKARNASGDQLLNYDGSANTSPNFAKAVTLTGTGLSGTLSNGAAAASSFTAGAATVSNLSFAFTTKLTAPGSLTLRAVDANASSNGYAEAGALIRSGRVRLSNAFGSEKAALEIPVQTQYWSNKSWVLNSADSCTNIPAAAVALSNYTSYQGTVAGWTTTASSVAISGGNGTLTLTAPSPSLTGTVDVAVNLGSTSADNACLSAHPATTGSMLSWLRSRNGSCAASYDKDPAARATFGIYTPESRRMIHVRPVY